MVIFVAHCTAQDQTTGQNSLLSYSNESSKSFLLVPMMDKMFLSNVTHEIGKYNQMNFRQVRSYFKDYISEMSALSAVQNWSISEANDTDSTLMKIQVAQSFDYDMVKVHTKAEESKIEEIWNSLQKKADVTQARRGAYLENGEIKEFYDGKERFMHAVVDTSWVFGQVLKDKEVDYVLFINELDINKPRPSDANYGSGERTVKLHFTVYNSRGKRVYGNAAFSTFAADELDIHSIANGAVLSAVNRMLAEISTELAGITNL